MSSACNVSPQLHPQWCRALCWWLTAVCIRCAPRTAASGRATGQENTATLCLQLALGHAYRSFAKECALILRLMQQPRSSNGRQKLHEACWCRHPHSLEQVPTGDPRQQDGLSRWFPTRAVSLVSASQQVSCRGRRLRRIKASFLLQMTLMMQGASHMEAPVSFCEVSSPLLKAMMPGGAGYASP